MERIISNDPEIKFKWTTTIPHSDNHEKHYFSSLQVLNQVMVHWGGIMTTLTNMGPSIRRCYNSINNNNANHSNKRLAFPWRMYLPPWHRRAGVTMSPRVTPTCFLPTIPPPPLKTLTSSSSKYLLPEYLPLFVVLRKKERREKKSEWQLMKGGREWKR